MTWIKIISIIQGVLLVMVVIEQFCMWQEINKLSETVAKNKESNEQAMRQQEKTAECLLYYDNRGLLRYNTINGKAVYMTMDETVFGTTERSFYIDKKEAYGTEWTAEKIEECYNRYCKAMEITGKK